MSRIEHVEDSASSRESLAFAVLLPKYTSFPIERARYPHTTRYYDLSTTIVSRLDRRTLLSWIDYRPSLESLHNFTPSPKRYTHRHAQSRFQGDCLVIRVRWSDTIRTSGPEVVLLSVWRFRLGHTGEIGPATTAEVSDCQRLRHAIYRRIPVFRQEYITLLPHRRILPTRATARREC